MNLDARTLLFSLTLTDTLMALCLVVAAQGQAGEKKADGLNKWAMALFLETLAWIAAASRGILPDPLAIVLAHGLKAVSHAMILAAIYEFQQRRAPNWQYFFPVAATLVMAFVLVNDTQSRLVWSSLIFIFQLLLIARALLSDHDTRTGRAWRLLIGGIAMFTLVMGARALAGLTSHGEFAQISNNVAPQPVQIAAFIASMAATLLGSIGFVLMVKERSDRATMQLAMTDSLTLISNRRALMEYAEHPLARRDGITLALLMVDVDRFKLINDTHGHLIGDEVLRKIASRLLERLRKQDLLGRYGGEEFCVIAPDTTVSGAITLAESLRATINSTPFSTECGDLSVSVSIGISFSSPNVTRSLNEVISEADEALLAAKKTGRNKVVYFGSTDAQATKSYHDR